MNFVYACALVILSYAFADSIRATQEKNTVDYLTKFGYLSDAPFAYAGPDEVSAAIVDLQFFAGLPPTGKIDSATLKLMHTPRCGVKDRLTHEGRFRRYVPHGAKWNKKKLTWMLTSENSSGLSRQQVEDLFTKGLKMWSDVTNLDFEKLDYRPKSTKGHVFGTPILTGENAGRCGPNIGADCSATQPIKSWGNKVYPCCSDGGWCGDAGTHCACLYCLDFRKPQTKADIEVLFARGDHGDTYTFDGTGGVLAHAFFPISNQGFGGDVHFDDAEPFTVRSSTGINLLWVIVHELGHSLGLQHSNVKDAVMYPWYTRYKPGFGLRNDDISGIQSIYGTKRTGITPTPTVKAQTTSSCSDLAGTAYCEHHKKRCIMDDWYAYMKLYCAVTCKGC